MSRRTRLHSDDRTGVGTVMITRRGRVRPTRSPACRYTATPRAATLPMPCPDQGHFHEQTAVDLAVVVADGFTVQRAAWSTAPQCPDEAPLHRTTFRRPQLRYQQEWSASSERNGLAIVAGNGLYAHRPT